MRIFYIVSLFFLASNIFATAPLESGYPLAPRASASQEERQRAYLEIRNLVIAAAMKYENTPYRYGGMSASGLDCSGFICLSFKDAIGVNLPRSASGLFSWVEKIPLDRAQPGDLLFFRTDGTGRVTHVGLYLGNRRFIHAASTGARTGVIINTLDEGNWTRNFAGAGRAFPEAAPGFVPENTRAGNSATPSSSATPARLPPSAAVPGTTRTASGASGGRLLLGVGFAPYWNIQSSDGSVVSGFTSQFRLGADTNTFDRRMIFGLEVRPEYNGMLNVFCIPITLSWGFDDKLRFFAGPVYESGEKEWTGIAGVTFSPFIFSTTNGEFAPYAEASWQSNKKNDGLVDGLQFSTGLRWTVQVNR